MRAFEMTYIHPVSERSSVEMTLYSPEYQEKYKEIYNDCFREMRKALNIKPYDFIQDDSFFETGMDKVYLLINGSEIIGSVALKDEEIDDLIVNPKYQGSGYGRQILLWALDHIQSEHVILHVAEWNQKAVCLYKKTGFEITKTTVIGKTETPMGNIRTNYEKWYEGETYYWGTEPADFCDELIKIRPFPQAKKVLDIGCGEGKDAVYMAKQGYEVTAFDLTQNGIRKTKALAEKEGVKIDAYVDDINTFQVTGQFDIVYSTGTVQYLFEENKEAFFQKIADITNQHGIVYFNVFVEKPFLELPPDWDKEEKMWKAGELFTYFADWKVHKIDEIIFEDHSGGVPHFHCMDTIICEKM